MSNIGFTSYNLGYARKKIEHPYKSNPIVPRKPISKQVSNMSFGSGWYIWGNINKTLVLQPTKDCINDIELFLDFASRLDSNNVDECIKRFIDKTIINNAEIQTNQGNLREKLNASQPGAQNRIAEFILREFANNKPIDVNVGKQNYETFKSACVALGLVVSDRDRNNGVISVKAPKKISLDKLEIPKGQEDLWKCIASIEQDGNGNNYTRGELIKQVVENPDQFNPETLATLDGFLKAAKVGIIPDNLTLPLGLNEKFLTQYTQLPQEQRKAVYGVVKSLYQQFPTVNTTTSIKRIANRGPVRHGILALKSAVTDGKWDNLGERGAFLKAIHQLAHQRPAVELGYVCIAYAQYLRTGGNINEFDRVLRDNGVSFEDYFVKYGNEINQPSQEWTSIKVGKPSVTTDFSYDQIRKAFDNHRWLDRSRYNVDELMSRPEPKAATFMQVYGETIINNLNAMGIDLIPKATDAKLVTKPELASKLNQLNSLKDNILKPDNKDENWKLNEGYPQAIQLATEIRSELAKDIQSSSDIKNLQGLINLDNNLEGLINTFSMNILAKAPSENGLYKLDKTTEKLLLNLVDNYALASNKNAQEFAQIKTQLQKAFLAPDRGSESWAEHAMVPLTQLQRIIINESNKVSKTYKPIAKNLAKISSNGNNQAIDQLADGILRGSFLFDISQITTGIKTQVRKMSGCSPWQVLSAGKVVGEVVHADSMKSLEEVIQKKKLAKQDTSNLICFVDHLDGAEEPPKGVRAIITPKVIDTLAHLGVRCRQENIVFACLDDPNIYKAEREAAGTSYVSLSVSEDRVSIVPASIGEYNKATAKTTHNDKKQPIVILPKADNNYEAGVLTLDDIKFSKSGPKANNIARLHKLDIQVPESVDIPFAVFDRVFNDDINKDIVPVYNEKLAQIENKQKQGQIITEKDLEEMKELTEKLVFPKDVIDQITKTVHEVIPESAEFFITRSSTNGEDLKDFSGAGLYESYPGVPKAKLGEYIKKVWASKWNKRAFDARVKADIPHSDLYVSVLIQPTIDAKHAFVVHTVNPITYNPDEVLIDLVQGQGEALVSGEIPGKGYGFIYNKKSGEVKRLHLADKSYRLVPDGKGRLKKALTNYEKDPFAGDKSQWEAIIRNIGENSVKIEKGYKNIAQDIEGCIDTKDKLYIVQTRDQLGLVKLNADNVSFTSNKPVQLLQPPVEQRPHKSINFII